ncbi:MAG: glycine cleavage system protein GcvH [Ignavibacteriae bacterium]|nr:glycine cleavage system protein GcvH [Ignavibacteriota bacterium]NOG96706.1 glycine cleavage system protein GcvH [Ignavibacteriota bacterium]
MNIPEKLRYSDDHEWIKVEDNSALIGITDYAQGELGDVVFVDIDPDLESITKGDSFGTIEAVKTVSDLFAPYSGKVLEINEKLADEPQLINTDPYGEGWIIKVEITDLAEIENLLDAAKYKEHIGQ